MWKKADFLGIFSDIPHKLLPALHGVSEKMMSET
jgi:hypothetical protein